MADLKLNKELHLDVSDYILKNLMGDTRLIACGSTVSKSVTKEAWLAMDFDSINILDDEYVEQPSGVNKIYIKKPGLYGFIIKHRINNNVSSEGVGPYIECFSATEPQGNWTNFTTKWGGGLNREISDDWFVTLIEEPTNISVKYYTTNTTLEPVDISLFIVETKEKKFPYDTYDKLEYLESSSAGQYIDCKFRPIQGYGFDVKFMAKSPVAGSGYGCIFGGRTSSGTNDYQLTTFNTYNTGTLRWGDSSNSSTSAGITPNTVQTCSLRTFEYTRPDGTTTVLPMGGSSLSAGGWMYIFGLNNNGTFTQYGSGCRIYYLKFYTVDNMMIRDLIPAKRKSDNVLGLYDLANDYFYTNAGSGTFTAGPVIEE